MADDDIISTDNQFMIEYYWEDLVKRINISSSILLDALLENGTITQEEGQILRVFITLSHLSPQYRNLIGPVIFSISRIVSMLSLIGQGCTGLYYPCNIFPYNPDQWDALKTYYIE